MTGESGPPGRLTLYTAPQRCVSLLPRRRKEHTWARGDTSGRTPPALPEVWTPSVLDPDCDGEEARSCSATYLPDRQRPGVGPALAVAGLQTSSRAVIVHLGEARWPPLLNTCKEAGGRSGDGVIESVAGSPASPSCTVPAILGLRSTRTACRPVSKRACSDTILWQCFWSAVSGHGRGLCIGRN